MSNYSILVVDDEADNFEVIEALLGSNGYTLHYSSRGKDAIAGLDKFDPDLILLDAMMPEMDGLEVCRQIKSMTQWQTVPIIMVTALNSKSDLARCLETGADDFVNKPINGVELRARVQSMIRIKKQHDRIQSLSKLQRNNIHSLENNLNDLRLDLAVNFPKELNTSLQGVLGCIEKLKANSTKMTAREIDKLLRLTQTKASSLDRLHHKFLFYLQLSLSERDVKTNSVENSKEFIEEIISNKLNELRPSSKMIVDLDDDVKLFGVSEHIQYTIGEILEQSLTHKGTSEEPLIAHGYIIDKYFHFWIDRTPKDINYNPDAKLSELIQCKSSNYSDLDIGLKIVKRFVEIYDGLFLMSETDRNGKTIYITLPLTASTSSSQLLVNV
jgi:two-component system, sensor histidine kinase and response regulator